MSDSPPADAEIRMAAETPINSISEADLMALISLAGEDARSISFRSELPGDNNTAKLDFVAEASSFANLRGGHMLYGVTPRAGLTPVITGLEKDGVDIAVGKLEQLAWKGITPRIPGLQVKAIRLDNSKWVLLVRIPQTWAGPHMVIYQHANNFFSRNAMGKYLMAVDELRGAFCLGDTLRDKVRAFRMERVNAVLNDGLSVKLTPETPRILLHIVPSVSFRGNFRLELDQTVSDLAQEARPMEARSLVSHFNYDGLITFSSIEKYAYSYVQMFRSGAVEAGESLMLLPKDGRKFIPHATFEREIIQCGERLIAFLKRLRINAPYAVLLSFLGIRGYSMMVSSMRWQSTSHHVERDNLFLDEVILEDGEQDFSRAIRPVFDQVWNSCGWAKSMNYDDNGNWREHTGR